MKRTASSRRNVLAASLTLALVSCVAPGDAPEKDPAEERERAWARAEATIEPVQLLFDITALSSDVMEGRAPGTRGERRTLAWLTHALTRAGAEFRVHVDGAYGGFYYPFADPETSLDFSNPQVSSVTLDAHKMLQAPYGTGIFLARKGLMEHVVTKEASYVEGQDYTLIGSRSGANAIAVWMILMKNGPYGWREKIFVLQKRAQWLCEQLDKIGAQYYRHPSSNIVTIRSTSISEPLAAAHWLVPDNHQAPAWYKIVVMEHVTIDKLEPFVAALGSSPDKS